MSHLQELIDQLCPDGVEYKKLGEVLKIKNGKDYKQFGPGNIPVYGSGGIMTYVDTAVYDRPSVLIPRKGSLDKLYYVDEPFWNVDTIFYTEINTLIVEPKFVFYWLEGQHLERLNKAGGVPSLTQTVLNKVLIPVPPMAVQREIVRILDDYSARTAELIKELEAELEARKKQYEFYRDQLLNFDDVRGEQTVDLQWKTLGEVCEVVAGGTPSKKNSAYWDHGNIRWLSSAVCDNKKTVKSITGYITQEGLENSSAKKMKEDTTLVALVGATIGKVAFLPFEAAINQNIAGIYPRDTNILNPSYVYYACTMLYPHFLTLTQGTKLAMANMSFVRSLKIPVPPLAEQERIVAILDRFDALCNDLTSGLPAEIAARQKQYEYYRDRLLSFTIQSNKEE